MGAVVHPTFPVPCWRFQFPCAEREWNSWILNFKTISTSSFVTPVWLTKQTKQALLYHYSFTKRVVLTTPVFLLVMYTIHTPFDKEPVSNGMALTPVLPAVNSLRITA